MTIEQQQVEGHVVLLVSGRMDAESAPLFEEKCRACIADGMTGLVVSRSRYAISAGAHTRAIPVHDLSRIVLI